jgi:thiol-disulfide isomerase/thioredoxin
MSKKLLLVFTVVLSLLMLYSCTRTEQSAQADDFKLPDLKGTTVRLSDFKGKPVLIDFWATWCPPCREAIPHIEKLHKSYSGKGLIVLGISLDQGGWDSVEVFIREQGVTYRILQGNDDVMAAYQVRTIPMAVLLNRDGKIVKRYLGFGSEGEIEKDILSLL